MRPTRSRLVALLIALLIAGGFGAAILKSGCSLVSDDADIGPMQIDVHGDPLPEGALARLGTIRFRSGCGIIYLGFSADGSNIAFAGAGRIEGGHIEKAIRIADARTGKELKSFDFDLAPLSSLGRPTLAPDGKTIAIACSNPADWAGPKKIKGAIVFWDTATGKEVRRIDTGGMPGRHLVFSPDGKFLVADNLVWEIATGKILAALPGDLPAISADGKLLAIASDQVFLFDTATWTKIRATELDGKSISTTHYPSLVLSPDGKWVAAATYLKGVHIWDASTGKLVDFLEAHCGYEGALSISSDSKLLAVAAAPTIIWDLTARKRVHALDAAGVAAFSPSGLMPMVLATGGPFPGTSTEGASPAVRFWNPISGEEVPKNDAPYGAVHLTQWLADGKLLAFSPQENGYRLWDTSSGKQLAKVLTGAGEKVQTGHKYPWWPVASPDGRFLAVGYWRGWQGDDEAIHLFDVLAGKEVRKFGPKEGSYPIAFLDQGRTLVANELVNRLAFWDTATGKLKRRLELAKEPKGGPKRFAFSADGKSLVMEMEVTVPPPPSKKDPSIYLEYFWRGVDLATGKERWRTANVKQTPDALAISPHGKVIACGIPGTMQLRDGDTGALLREIDSGAKTGKAWHRQEGAMAFTPDGKKLIAGDHLTNVYVWEVASGNELHKFAGHRGRVFSVSVSPGGNNLATASEDSTVLLWRLEKR